MSDDQPVVLEGIPVFTGDLALLDATVKELTKDGAKIATAAGDIHSSFGGLQAFYQAPEADQLFATTKPVADRGAALKSDLATITGALGTYSDEAYPLVEKLRQLKRDAGAFLVKVNADDTWREDGDLVEENNNRRNEIAETWAAFQAVERACYNKIIATVPGGKRLTTNDGSGGKHMYGYDAEALKQAKGLPWGDPVKESTRWYQFYEHVWDFGKGFVVDGVWGTVKGLGTLFGTEGWDTAKQAWTGLGNLATGVILTVAAPHVLWLTPEKDLPGFARDARNAMKETGKALIAYDQWGENPARAGGAVTFNVLTTVFTGGAGGGASGAGKAAAAAKALSFANKASRVVDPTTYLFKGAGAGLTKISDVMAGLKGSGAVEIPPLPDNIYTLPEGGIRLPDGTVHLPAGTATPDGAIRLPDGTVKLPEGTVALPEGTVRNPFDQGAPYVSREGHLYNEDGSIAQLADQARNEKAPEGIDATRSGIETPTPEPALVGAGRTVHEATNNIPPNKGSVDNGDSVGHTPGRNGKEEYSPTASHQPFSESGDSSLQNHSDSAPAGGNRTEESSSNFGGETPRHGNAGGTGDETALNWRESASENLPPDHSSSSPDWEAGHFASDGMPYVDEPQSAFAARAYDEIRANVNDTQRISDNTGIPKELLDRVKEHLFLTVHRDFPVGPNQFATGRVAPFDHIAKIWKRAEAGDLSEVEMVTFRRLVTHEGVESVLMREGMPYRGMNYDDEGTNWYTKEHYGAHDISPHEHHTNPYVAWPKLGMSPPPFDLLPDLSNLDDLISYIRRNKP
ncbi:hypothetical protein [Streptomyces pakalii]|uniref:Uncharacterized protein n=1 Tax=Streptomyces pakalii TaxID=3036494 RepID=A0ABT7DBD2_9ACTN|nr:hypothetical protein [Streptomyces pakalii]MDJ1643100.1 hypothetical protein [Streptomyces pakalii]